MVGVNLLREGLDLPEVSLVAILDADKQGFLRSRTSLIQVSGRAARNINGEVVMYADSVSQAMRDAIDECDRRRKIQTAFNEKHNITPTTIRKAIRQGIEELAEEKAHHMVLEFAGQDEEEYAFSNFIAELERQMENAARNLQFEKAALIRDKIKEMKDLNSGDVPPQNRKKRSPSSNFNKKVKRRIKRQ